MSNDLMGHESNVHPLPGGQEEEQKYETQELLRPRVMMGFFLSLTLIVVAALIISALLERFFVARAGPPRPLVAAAGSQLPPQPQVQPDPGADMRALDLTQRALLDSYGWANQEKTAARVPIDRAMEIVARRGLLHGKPMMPSTNKAQEEPLAR